MSNSVIVEPPPPLTLTLEELRRLLSLSGWVREQDFTTIDAIEIETEHPFCLDPRLVSVTRVFGWASKTSTFGSVKIEYAEGYSYDDNEPDTFSTGDVTFGDTWTIGGVEVVDGDGVSYDIHDDELTDIFAEHGLNDIDYTEVKAGIKKIDEIDIIDGIETVTIEVSNAPDVKFCGRLIAHAKSCDSEGMGFVYSGHVGMWEELTIYFTQTNRFICHRGYRTKFFNRKDYTEVEVCETESAVRKFFGSGELANELMESTMLIDVFTSLEL